MDFLKQFDALEVEGNEKRASKLLFQEMRDNPEKLCKELRADRPILRFWSKKPGNPDLEVSGPASKRGGDSDGGGYAYLLTRSEDVRIALENFSMKSYRRVENRYFLAMDEEARHEKLRSIFTASLEAVDKQKVVDWSNEAVEEAWDLQYQDAENWENSDRSGEFYLDIREFSREATLRFCGRYYGLPRVEVVKGKFRDFTADAFTQFIWKLFARHFVATPRKEFAIPELAKVAAVALMAANFKDPETFTDYLVRNNLKSRPKVLGGEPEMTQKELVSNLIGGFQGFIDNAVSCTCLTLNALLENKEHSTRKPNAKTDKYTYQSLQDAKPGETLYLMRDVLCLFPPAPWLPRFGKITDLPGWKDVSELYGSNPDDEPGLNSSCILAMQSAMADFMAAETYPVSPRPDEITQDETRYGNKEDLRLGYGYHRCVGLELSDTVVANILKKIATLDDVKIHKKLNKKWAWIIESFAISGSAAKAPDWARLTNSEEPVAIDHAPAFAKSEGGQKVGNSSLEAVSSIQLKNLRPSVLASLKEAEFACLSDQQLNALTDSQLNALTAGQIAALQSRINVLLCEQLVMLSKDGLSGLKRSDQEQPSVVESLDAQKVRALLQIRSKDLAPELKIELKTLASRNNIRAVTRKKTARPHAHSLWSISYNTHHSESYTTWPGLIDKSWTARQLPVATDEYMSFLRDIGNFQSTDSPGLFASLFRRPDGKNQEKCAHTSLLFTWFAQWISDSFLRTDPSDRRRNQSNHQVDLCQLYGLDEATTSILREHKGGRLLSGTSANGDVYLPRLFDDNGEIKTHFRGLSYIADGSIRTELEKFSDAKDRCKYLFAAGLDRGNSTFGYTAISTLFLREHNRICKKLAKNEKDWDDERLFQTARMILTVMLLNIVITEYINHIATPDGKKPIYTFDPSFAEDETWYRPPRITLEFNLLYRWHSMVPGEYKIESTPFKFSEFRFNNKPLHDYGLGKLLHEASCQPAGRPGLFNTEPELLRAEYSALKMSRDYRVASFNEYRKHFDLPEILSFHDLTDNKDVVNELKKRYNDPSEIEFLVGLYAEEPVFGRGLFGGLMTTMLGYDAFTQTLTNPLLSRNVYNKETFTKWGLEETKATRSLNDLWVRNRSKRESDLAVSLKLI